MEVRRQHTTLVRSRWHHKEIESASLVRVFDKSAVNDTSRWWVDQLAAALIFDKEALRDALVDHDESDLGRSGSSIVKLSEGLSKLLDLFVDDLRAHGIADAVAVDKEMGRELPVVMPGEDFDRFLDALFHLTFDDFLALPLHNILRVVLTELAIRAGSKADHRLWAGVAHVDTYEHCSSSIKDGREL